MQVLIPAGHLVFKQGDPSDSLYIVSTGRLDVSLEPEGQEPVSIYEAGRGQIVGEMGVLTGEPRSATVRSLRDSLLFRLSKDRFEELIELHPALTRRIACNLSDRLRQSNIRPVHPPHSVKTFAVLPAGGGAPTESFVEALTRALGEIGTTRRITKAAMEEALGTGEVSDSGVVHWLNEQETRFAFLVYEADPHPSPWTSRCIRQADRLLSVARFEDDKGLNAIENDLARMAAESPRSHPRIDLVLLHRDSGGRPAGTPEWLAGRFVDRHHHVWDNSPKGFTRLARVLTGKGIGVVLGGGGARGFAHIGAIRAIEEAGITIETVGGTSQGALIAAQYAMGQSPAQMIETNRALFRDYRPFKGDKTIPLFSFVTGKTSNKGLQGLFGNTHITDLSIPFFCVSTNMSLAKLIVHREDAVWRAVRCSMALPGLMPPIIQKGNLIIDGGVLNNLPVDVMRRNSNGAIVAVEVSPPVDLIADCEDRDSFSCVDFLRRKLFRGKRSGDVPHIIEILMRTAFLSSIHHRQEMAGQADLCIHPPMAGYSLLGWENLEALAEAGYQVTREMLQHWDAPATLRNGAPDVQERSAAACANVPSSVTQAEALP